MSTIKVDTIQDTSGNEQFTAKAWVNFNGTGTVAIRNDGNVSSITDNDIGDYTVNLSFSFATADYSAPTSAASATSRALRIAYPFQPDGAGTASYRMQVDRGGAASDAEYVHGACLGDLA